MNSCANCGFETHDDFRFCPSCGTQSVGETPRTTLIGRTLGGKYRVIEEIGSGSMGTVYRAEQIALKKPVALKVLRQDIELADDSLRRFQREGIAAGQVNHPNAIQIFDFDQSEDGSFYLAMELVEGENLKLWLSRRGPLPSDEAVELVAQLLGTLVEAHGHGIVHRDLKPENLMVVESPSVGRSLKVLDFGLSKLVDRPLDVSQQTIPGRVLGTPLYMAPEQWKSEPVDHRTDLYAATLILYEMLAGKPPFGAHDVTEVMVKTTSEPPPLLTESLPSLEVSDDLEDIVQRGLAKDREERYQSAAEMLQDLEGIDFDQPLRATSRRSPRRSQRMRRPAPAAKARNPLQLVGVVAGVLGVVALAAYFAVGSGGASASSEAPLVRQLPAEQRDADQKQYLGLLADAQERLAESDPSAAIAIVDRALKMPCADAEGYVVRAEISRRRADDDTAMADYRRALELYPQYAEALAGIGFVQLTNGDLDQAQSQVDAALEAASDSSYALALQGAVQLQRGDPSTASKLLDEAAGIHPDSAVVQLWRGKAKLAQEDLAGAVAAFDRAKRADGTLWEASAGLGDAKRMQGDGRAAERHYRDAIAAAPDAHAARGGLVELLIDGGDFDEAETVLLPALRARPFDGVLRVFEALIAIDRGDVPEAIDALEMGLDRGVPDEVRVLTLLAGLKLESGDLRGAAEQCAAAADLGDSAVVFATWGLALFRLGEFVPAAEKLESAVALDPRDTSTLYSLGVIYMDYLDDAESARKHLQAYLDQGGTRANVREWIRRLGG